MNECLYTLPATIIGLRECGPPRQRCESTCWLHHRANRHESVRLQLSFDRCNLDAHPLARKVFAYAKCVCTCHHRSYCAHTQPFSASPYLRQRTTLGHVQFLLDVQLTGQKFMHARINVHYLSPIQIMQHHLIKFSTNKNLTNLVPPLPSTSLSLKIPQPY